MPNTAQQHRIVTGKFNSKSTFVFIKCKRQLQGHLQETFLHQYVHRALLLSVHYKNALFGYIFRVFDHLSGLCISSLSKCKLIIFHCLLLTTLLLTTCGDVHPNPGPYTSNVQVINTKSYRTIHANNFVTLSWNCNSLRGKIDELRSIVVDINPEVIGLCETKLNSAVPNKLIQIDGYRCLRHDRPASTAGGGCMIYVKDNIICRRRHSLELDDIEAIVADIKIGMKYVGFILTYRPPKTPLQMYFDELSELTESLLKNRSEIIIMGDMNCDLLRATSAISPSNYLETFMDNFALENQVLTPTRPASGALIDVILSSNPKRFTSCDVIATGASDHSLCVTSMLNKAPKLPPKEITYRRTRKTDFDALNHDLCSTNWAEAYSSSTGELLSANEVWSRWVKKLNDVLDRHAPLKKRLIKFNRPPWIGSEIEDAIRKRDILSKDINSPSKLNCFRQYRNHVNSMKRNAKRLYLQQSAKSKPKKFHHNLQYITGLGKDKKHSIPSLMHENKLYNSPSSKAELLREHFVSILPAQKSLSDKELCEHSSVKKIQNLNFRTFTLNYTSDEEIYRIVSKLDKNKATGPDNISASLLKSIIPSINAPLTDLFNHLITISEVPTDWKRGYLTPIFKRGDASIRSNYRPVTILTHISKMFERVIADQLTSHFLDIFPEDMHGFLKGHSSETALLKLTQDCRYNLDNNNKTAILSLDLSKAFDLVNHKLLLKKLQAYGLCSASIQLIESYLSERSQQVRVDSHLSTRFKLPSGVPQGSILGPILFNIFFSDLSYSQINSSMVRYADDITLYHSTKSWQETIQILNKDLASISSWLTFNDFLLNANKTQAIKLNCIDNETTPEIIMNGTKIKYTNTISLLGIILDNNLSFREQLRVSLRRANICLSLLRQVKRSLSPQLALQLYKIYVRPYVEYCSSLYLPLPESCKSRLERFQRSALRQLRIVKHEVSFNQINYPQSLEHRRIAHSLNLLHKCLHTGTPQSLRDFFTLSPGKYNLRFYYRLEQPRCRKTFMKSSFASIVTKEWNLLEDGVKKMPYAKFKYSLLHVCTK